MKACASFRYQTSLKVTETLLSTFAILPIESFCRLTEMSRKSKSSAYVMTYRIKQLFVKLLGNRSQMWCYSSIVFRCIL